MPLCAPQANRCGVPEAYVVSNAVILSGAALCAHFRAAVYSLVNVPNCYVRLLRLADSLDCTSQRSTAARTA